MQKILYFNKEGYCTERRNCDSIFSMMCFIPENFETEGIPIEDFICEPKFKISYGRHISSGNIC